MYKYLCYPGTLYAFLQYLLISEMDIENTLFVFSESMNNLIGDKFECHKIILKGKKGNFFQKKRIEHENYKKLNLILSKNENIKVYLQDHLKEAEYFLEKFNCYLLEDGTDSYNLIKINKNQEKYKLQKYRIKPLRKLLGGSLKRYPRYGFSDKIIGIYMNGIFKIPDKIQNKVIYLDIKGLFNKLSIEKKEKLFNIFNLELEVLNKMENKILLLTQPFSEDTLMTEEEKIKIYRDIQESRKGNTFIIKSHPREQTDYKKYFPEVYIMPKDFPAELFLFVDAKLKEVITVFSTAALNLKENYKVTFLGTESYPKLIERFGIIKKNRS